MQNQFCSVLPAFCTIFKMSAKGFITIYYQLWRRELVHSLNLARTPYNLIPCKKCSFHIYYVRQQYWHNNRVQGGSTALRELFWDVAPGVCELRYPSATGNCKGRPLQADREMWEETIDLCLKEIRKVAEGLRMDEIRKGYQLRFSRHWIITVFHLVHQKISTHHWTVWA